MTTHELKSIKSAITQIAAEIARAQCGLDDGEPIANSRMGRDWVRRLQLVLDAIDPLSCECATLSFEELRPIADLAYREGLVTLGWAAQNTGRTVRQVLRATGGG